MGETLGHTELIETDRHTWRECLGCGTILEEKVFSKVVKDFEEVNLLKFPNDFSAEQLQDGYYKFENGKYVLATKKEIEQATRRYKVGDEYQWFGYNTGGKHICNIVKA